MNMDTKTTAFGIVLLVYSFTSLSQQESTRATLFITLKEYNNTNSELYNGDCCDGLAVSNKCSSDRCDYVITICVSPDESGSWCQSTELNADQPSDLIFQDQTQRELPIAEWKGSALVNITITDIDGPYTQQLVDKFSFNYTEKGSKTPQSQELLLHGTRARPSRLRLSMAIQCQTYYYGDECSVFCIPSVDCKGHYTCDEKTGAKICEDGWEGKDCTRPVGVGSCPGQHCENGGTCSIDKFSNTSNTVFFCCCPPGYTGNRCEIDLNECSQNPCLYGGTCRNTQGSYICNCQPRYRGMHCEIPTTCKDNPCRNGKCSDSANGTFTCHCGSDFSGMLCENVITTTTRSTTTTSTTTESTTSTTTTTTPSTTSPTTTPTTETFTSTPTSVATTKTLSTTKPSSTTFTTEQMTSIIVTPSSGKTAAPAGGSQKTSQVTFPTTNPTLVLSTMNSKSSLEISSSPDVVVTTVHSAPNHNEGNLSVTLSGKIPDKEIPVVKQVITNAVKNTSKGENCTDIKILDKEYLYSITREVYTKVIYNSSDCPDASDLHKNPNLTHSLNNQLSNSGQLSNHGVFNGKTTGLGRSYHVPLIGYVYNIYRSGIKGAIKRAWSNAGNKLVDVLIVDAAYKIGDYGIYITDITYLVTSGLTFLQPRPENIPKDQSFYKEFRTEFRDMQVLTYSGNESYGYESGLRLSLQQRKRTTPLTTADLYSKALAAYKNVLKDNGLCLQQSCAIGMTLSPLEETEERSLDVVLYPTLDGHLNTEPTILKALKTKLSTQYQICNDCKKPRLHYIDVAGRVKLKDENSIRNAIDAVFETVDASWKKQSFLSVKNSTATRLHYLPSSPNDTRTEWPKPNMEGKLDLINSSLSSINRKLAVNRMKQLHQLVLKEAVPKSEQKSTSQILDIAWTTTNKHVSQRVLTSNIESWSNLYVSSKGETVTLIKYTVTVMNADSSLAAVSPPNARTMETALKSSDKTMCNCRAYKVRMLWTKDMQEFNSTVIQNAVSNAWVLANNGFNLIIPVKVINSESGYVAGSGDNVRMYTYFIQPRKGSTEVEEEDLEHPSSVELEQELSKLVPGSRVFSTASKKSEPEGTEWWVYVVIAIGCLALVIILVTLLITALRVRNHRQSRTLKQDPKQVNGYDKEHFSKEPVMEKNSNGLYTVEDEDTDYSKTTYIVNDAYNYQE